MRIAVNGWFRDRPDVGSGQYLAALLDWLPRVGEGHEFVVVGPATGGRRQETGERRQESGVRGQESEARGQESGVRGQRSEADGLHAPLAQPDPSRSTASCRLPIANRKSAIQNPKSKIQNPKSAIAKLWFEQIAFPLACRRLKADVAFVPYWAPPVWSPCPVVVTIHDLIPLLLPLYRGGPLQRAYTALVSRTARRAAAIITDSAASKADIVAHLRIPAEQVHAIHLGAGPRRRTALDAAELARVRAKYNLPDAPFLLYLAGFDARKNVVRMIEAYARVVARSRGSGVGGHESGVRSQGSGVRSQPASSADPCPLSPVPCLVIAGKLPAADTPFAPDPRPVVGRLGIGDLVHFTGWVDEADKPALHALALGSVFVSEYEGFGLPVVEGMGG